MQFKLDAVFGLLELLDHGPLQRIDALLGLDDKALPVPIGEVADVREGDPGKLLPNTVLGDLEALVDALHLLLDRLLYVGVLRIIEEFVSDDARAFGRIPRIFGGSLAVKVNGIELDEPLLLGREFFSPRLSQHRQPPSGTKKAPGRYAQGARVRSYYTIRVKSP